MNGGPLCLALLRWGGWPGWISLTLRSLALNPHVRFLLLGDERPLVAEWPQNIEFHAQTQADVMERLRARLGAAPPAMRGGGSTSKISDFKPLLGDLYSDLLLGCGWWGYMQEDQILGDLNHFLDDKMLTSYDTISPLGAPKYNAGPFMLYRNTRYVNSLYRRSADLARVVKAADYQVFDEWWGPLRDTMPSVIRREAEAGRLRAYTANNRDGKWWLSDDYIYEEGKEFKTSAEENGASFNASEETLQEHNDKWWMRFYDSTMHFTWRSGALWTGSIGQAAAGSVQAKELPQQVAVLHLLGSKELEVFRRLEPTDHLRRLAAHTTEIRVSRHGVFLKVSADGHLHAWYSGRFPSLHGLVRSSELARVFRVVGSYAKPNASNHAQIAKSIDAQAPCLAGARYDDVAIPSGSCSECRRVMAAAQAVAINNTAAACGGVELSLAFRCDAFAPAPLRRQGDGTAPESGAASRSHTAMAATGRTLSDDRGGTHRPSTCAPMVMWSFMKAGRGISAKPSVFSAGAPSNAIEGCRSVWLSLARSALGVHVPWGPHAQPIRLRGLTPSFALAYGLSPCLGKAMSMEQVAARGKNKGVGGTPPPGERRFDAVPGRKRQAETIAATLAASSVSSRLDELSSEP